MNALQQNPNAKHAAGSDSQSDESALVANGAFPVMNRAYNQVFKPGKLSIGLVVPIENYASSAVPQMHDHLQRIQLADQLGFSAVWLRDVPFNVPSFGDAGQLFDPFVYLGYLAASTQNIALGVASLVLPLRHPAHVAKAAASVDVLSGGRLLLGVASGDRSAEYPAMNLNYLQRGEQFRDSMAYIRAMAETNPSVQNAFGRVNGDMDLLPKPTGKLPLLVTGGSQQSPDWIAQHSDGWMIYPRDLNSQALIVREWRDEVTRMSQSACRHSSVNALPVMQPLYFDWQRTGQLAPQTIHLGFRSGMDYLVEYLTGLELIGVNHVALNLRFNQQGTQQDIEQTLENLAEHVLPVFS